MATGTTVGTVGPPYRGLGDSREAGGIRGTSGSRGLRATQEARTSIEGIPGGGTPERKDRDSPGESIKGRTVTVGGPPRTGDKEYGNGHG